MIDLARMRLRLLALYGISGLLSRFRSPEETIREVVNHVNLAIPLTTAILLDGRKGALRMLVWHSAEAGPEALLRAEANMRSSYAFLAAPLPGRPDPMEVARVPVDFGKRPLRVLAEPDVARRNFMTLPLAVERGAIFGALQVEGAGSLDEEDLAFVDAVVNLAALAIDRHRLACRERASEQALQHGVRRA